MVKKRKSQLFEELILYGVHPSPNTKCDVLVRLLQTLREHGRKKDEVNGGITKSFTPRPTTPIPHSPTPQMGSALSPRNLLVCPSGSTWGSTLSSTCVNLDTSIVVLNQSSANLGEADATYHVSPIAPEDQIPVALTPNTEAVMDALTPIVNLQTPRFFLPSSQLVDAYPDTFSDDDGSGSPTNLRRTLKVHVCQSVCQQLKF
jgi:hypothetical protein